MGKKIMSVLLTVILLALPLLMVSAEGEIKYSNKNYSVFYSASQDVFLCNRKAMGSKAGTQYFMTYTVKSVGNAGATQQGVVGTADISREYPYDNGGYMQYEFSQDMLMEGYTYFLKFTVTDDGYDYLVARAKGEESEYVILSMEWGDKTDQMQYFGLWMGVGSVSAELEKVRCYDRDGNDLGVQVPGGRAAVISEDAVSKEKTIDHRYEIKVKEQSNLAVSNELPTSADKIYMEYTVASATGNLYQNGLICSNAPDSDYPFDKSGLLLQNEMKELGEGPLLTVGADYLITFERGAYCYTGVVQKTLNGKTEFFVFPLKYGTYDKTGQYFSLWFGEGDTHKVSLELKNFKCYDEKKNNLKVQTNKASTIKHIGALEDYSGCEAFYYCEQDDSAYVLYADQTLKYTSAERINTGKYSISSNVITINMKDSAAEKLDYKYYTFTDAQGKVYNRLFTYKLNFVTGSGTKIETQTLNIKNSYIAAVPQEPELNGATFKGWYRENGTAYDFNKYVTKSETLYAKWSNADGKEYLSIDAPAEKKDMKPFIAVGLSLLIILAAGAVSTVLIVWGKKYAKK